MLADPGRYFGSMAASKSLPVIGVAEIGYLLGVSRTRVSQLVKQQGFPAAIELRMGKVWWWDEFIAWAGNRGRLVRPLPPSWPFAPDGGVAGGPMRGGSYRRPSID